MILEGDLRPVTDTFQQRLKRNGPFPEPEYDPASQAGSIRTAQDPVAFPAQRVRPKRLLPPIQCDSFNPNRQFSTFPVTNNMRARQRCPQFARDDHLLRTPPLKTGLGLRHAVFDGLNAMPSCQRPPRADTMRLDDHVRV